MKKLIVSVAVATLLFVLFYYFCLSLGTGRCKRNDWLDLLFAVAWILGSMASGSAHAPNFFVLYTSLFIMFLAPVYLLASCVELLQARFRRGRRG